MPMQARIDAPGALHHIIVRGIERRNIFNDDHDRYAFLERLGPILEQTHTACYAWTLIPNHFHLLLRTGTQPVASVMRRLLTGYAMGTIAGKIATGTFSKTAINQFYARKMPISSNWSVTFTSTC